MNLVRGLFLVVGVGLLAAGCILTSGQIQIAFDLPNVTASTLTGIVGETIDLSDEEEYADNKDKIKTLSDLAVLGKFINESSGAVDVEVWITKDPSSHLTESALKSDPTAVKVWGPFHLEAGGSPGDTKVIDWDESAKLFTIAGKNALIAEAKGDGQFSVYAVGAAGTYSFRIENGVLVLVLDAGI